MNKKALAGRSPYSASTWFSSGVFYKVERGLDFGGLEAVAPQNSQRPGYGFNFGGRGDSVARAPHRGTCSPLAMDFTRVDSHSMISNALESDSRKR